jgi:hypothetical protein
MAKTPRWFKAGCLDWEAVLATLPRPLSNEAMRLDYLSLQSQGYRLTQRALAERWGCSRGRVVRLIQACDPRPIQSGSKTGPTDPRRTPNIKRQPIQSGSKVDPERIQDRTKTKVERYSERPLRKERKRINSSQSEHGFQGLGEAQVLSFRERLMRRGNG